MYTILIIDQDTRDGVVTAIVTVAWESDYKLVEEAIKKVHQIPDYDNEVLREEIESALGDHLCGYQDTCFSGDYELWW